MHNHNDEVEGPTNTKRPHCVFVMIMFVEHLLIVNILPNFLVDTYCSCMGICIGGSYMLLTHFKNILHFFKYNMCVIGCWLLQ